MPYIPSDQQATSRDFRRAIDDNNVASVHVLLSVVKFRTDLDLGGLRILDQTGMGNHFDSHDVMRRDLANNEISVAVYAVVMNRVEILKEIESFMMKHGHGRDYTTDYLAGNDNVSAILCGAALNSPYEGSALECLLMMRPRLAVLNFKRMNALHVAAKYNNYHAIPHLVKAGCDINAVDGYGFRPLNHAIRHSSFGAIEQLVMAGCDIADDHYKEGSRTWNGNSFMPEKMKTFLAALTTRESLRKQAGLKP